MQSSQLVTQRSTFIFIVEEHRINCVTVEVEPLLLSLGSRALAVVLASNHGPGPHELDIESSSFHELVVGEVMPNAEWLKIRRTHDNPISRREKVHRKTISLSSKYTYISFSSWFVSGD